MSYPKPLQKLIDVFTELPGIGPKQAARFALFLLKEKEGVLPNFVNALREVQGEIGYCEQCFRTVEHSSEAHVLCTICRDPKRTGVMIAVVEKEPDMHNLEKTSVYNGQYHILHGVISPLDSESPKKLHLRALYDRVKLQLEQQKKCEVVLATNATTEGTTTALYIERILAPLKDAYTDFKISRLGRGLSIGSELEYADDMTLRYALEQRK